MGNVGADFIILTFQGGIDLPLGCIEGHRSEVAMNLIDTARNLSVVVRDDKTRRKGKIHTAGSFIVSNALNVMGLTLDGDDIGPGPGGQRE